MSGGKEEDVGHGAGAGAGEESEPIDEILRDDVPIPTPTMARPRAAMPKSDGEAALISNSATDALVALLAADPRLPEGGMDALIGGAALPADAEPSIFDVTPVLDKMSFSLMIDILRANGNAFVPMSSTDASAAGPVPPIATVVSRAQEEDMMRQPMKVNGEKPCMAGKECAGMTLRPNGFVAMALPVLNARGEDAEEENLCVFCLRRVMNQVILSSRAERGTTPITVNYANIADMPGEYVSSQCFFTQHAVSSGIYAPVAVHCLLWYTTYVDRDLGVLRARQTGYKTVNFQSGASA